MFMSVKCENGHVHVYLTSTNCENGHFHVQNSEFEF